MATNRNLIIFDLDNTLIDFDTSIKECWQRVYDNFCSEFPHIPAEHFHKSIKEYADWYWADPERHRIGRLDLVKARCNIISEGLRKLGTDNVPLACRMAEFYTSERENAHVLVPDTLEVLENILSQGTRLAMATNGAAEVQRRKIEKFRLERYFDIILVEGEFGAGKPDERVYRHILEQTGVDSENAWMVGDNLEWDVFAPMRVGITGVWFNPRDRELPFDCCAPPDRVIRTLRELV